MSSKIRNIGRVTKIVKLKRALWNVCYVLCFRLFPTQLFWWWRWLLLRIFGAKISYSSHVYSSVKIWAPWNLEMYSGSCLGPNVICYNQAKVVLEENACVSQYSYLCTAGHTTDEVNNAETSLIIGDIVIKKSAWIGTRAFIGLGVEIGEGAIVGATASVYKDVEPWTIVGGNPAKFIKKRVIRDE